MDVILVDENDVKQGSAEKMQAHREGMLHRAFSVFVFNSRGQVLLQKRADKKYHSGGLWSNACCSHPRSDDLVGEAQARLQKEMGISVPLKKAGEFVYIAQVGELVEHEYDHVLVGVTDDEPSPDSSEVSEWKWHDVTLLKEDIRKNPDAYAPWLAPALEIATK